MGFKSVMCPPPTGEFFFEHGGERVSAPTWNDFFPKMQAFMRKHGLGGAPEDLAASYMCPHLPDWYCTKGGIHVPGLKESRDRAVPYFARHVVPYDEIIRRLAVCRTCPKHSRNVCLTCTGALDWVVGRFGGRRKRLPDDTPSGTCLAAGTFESVVASVDMRGVPAWEGTPDNCWRNKP